MNLANPYALLLLGLVPVILLIHSLKPKPQQLPTTTLFLWREALRERGGGLRLGRFLRNLPLMLQVAFVVLAAAALADPFFTAPRQSEADVIVVLDASASMKARGPEGTRFEAAREKALAIVDGLARGKKMLLVEAAGIPRLRCPFTTDRDRLRKALEAVEATDVPGDLERALYMALSFADPVRRDTLVCITDGADEGIHRLLPLHPRIRPVIVSGGTKNVGITRFAFRRQLEHEDRYEILVEIRNYDPVPVLCPLRISLDGVPLVTRTVPLKGEEKRRLIFPYSGLIAGTAEALLETGDDFPTDDKAYAVLTGSKDIWVLLVTEGNFFLERLLASYPNVMVNSVHEIIDSSWAEQTRGHDVVILDRKEPPPSEYGNFLCIETTAPFLPLESVGRVRSPVLLDWDRTSPLTRGLDLSGLRIAEAMEVKVKEPLSPLMESRETGLMYAYEKGALRAVFMGFDLGASDLPLRVAFPVLMSNLFHWLYPHKLRAGTHQVQADQPFPIYLEPGTEEFFVRGPQGKWRRFAADRNPYIYGDTDKAGLYVIREGRRQRQFAVNLLDETESGIVPTKTLEAQTGQTDAGPQTVRVRLPLWPYLLLLGTALLLAEWHAWWKKR